MKRVVRGLGLLLAVAVACGLLSADEEKSAPRPKTLRGLLAKVDAASLTVVTRGDSGERSHVFAIDAKTSVERETDQDEVYGTGEGGQPRIRPKREKIAAAELKTGTLVSVTYHEGGATLGVLVLRVKKPRVGEGERNGEQPPRPQPEGPREGRTESNRGQPDKPAERSTTSQDRRESSRAASPPPVPPSAPQVGALPQRSAVPAGVTLPAARLVASRTSGAWSAPDTWEGGRVPGSGDQVLVRQGHQVVYDVTSDAILRSLHISGTLSFAPDRDTVLNVGLIRVEPGNRVVEEGFDCDHPPEAKPVPLAAADAAQPGFSAICLCCQAKAALLVGTPERPIDARHQAVIRLHYVEGMNAESCPAIVVCGGRMDVHGAPLSRTWVKLGRTIRPAAGGESEIILAEPVTGWRAGDRIIVTKSGHPDSTKDDTEESVIRHIEGTHLWLETPLVFTHLGEGDFRAEVANLSRNVVIESAAPQGIRGHVMYHRGSAGSISYAEFRHLGKQGVLGRYTLHYHLCGDSMRGASIVGASFHDSHNRWLTVHGTNYLVVRDCVGYRSIGHGFFLEDGTEVYNVFDRNLACQALEGRPLPKQVLPFDANDGAGFWFANAHNTFTRNVAVQCRQYGFRYEATPRAGVIPTDGAPKRDFTFGNPQAPLDLVFAVRQPDGSRANVDIRTLPFVRFDDNESHSNGFWGLNLGLGTAGVGPDASHPFVIRNLRIWNVVGGIGVESPHVLIDGMTIHGATYGVRGSRFYGHDWRLVSINARGRTITRHEEYVEAPSARHRQPGWTPAGSGDGGAVFQPPEVETARLAPVDDLPPQTVITSVRREGSQLIVRGTTADNGNVVRVTVNDVPARDLGDAWPYAQWEAVLHAAVSGTIQLRATAEDETGNREQTPHEMTVVAP